MSKFEPTDDQLLSFLIGDLPNDEEKSVEVWLEENETHRERLIFLKMLRNELKNTDMTFNQKSSRSYILPTLRLGAVLGAFVLGVWMQAHWHFVSLDSPSGSEELVVSEPLSWENFNNNEIL